MAAVIVNRNHHEFVDNIKERFEKHTAKQAEPLFDTLLVLDVVFFLFSSAFDSPTPTKNQEYWNVFHFLFSRAMKTFRSIRHLIENGYDQDGLALLRNLVDTCLTTKYIAGADTAARAQRFQDYIVVERYRNMAGYRDAGFDDFKKYFSEHELARLEDQLRDYEQKYQVKFRPTLNWANMSPYEMAKLPEVNMLHDYLQGFSTYSMFTHASYIARDSYTTIKDGERSFSWVPTFERARGCGLLACGYMLKVVEACVDVMGIEGLDDLLLEITCNLIARNDMAGYRTKGPQIIIEQGTWGMLRRDSETGQIIP